jgi:branched-chain amino acid aminotransferase
MAFRSVDGGIQKVGNIWVNGEFVPWDECRVHVLTHALHYGSGVFEGIRCYETKTGPAVLRLREHVERLFNSARVYRMELPFTVEELEAACLSVIEENELSSCYLRPIAFRGYGSLGVNPLTCPVDVAIAAFPWGKYLGEEALKQGVDVRVSSWNRMAPNTFPAVAKTTANYANSQLIKMEALADGYAEGIALDVRGYVSEGSGENIFMVRNGRLLTPSLSCAVLPGITRDCVMRLAADRGLEVEEAEIPRSLLYQADELFFTGTAAEVSPIRSVDRITIGCGSRGPVTEQLQSDFFAILDGSEEDRHGWLTPVGTREAVERAD